jgi:exonuclease SbcC
VRDMITKVKLKNFRSHLDSEFDFSSGTNALVGILGSGKSTVMNALSFGLFGTFPDLQAKKIKLDDIIMNKPSLKDTAEVEVDFVVDEKTYSVMRTVERGKGTTYSEIREGDKLLDAPNTQRVTELVEKTLKVNYELFSKAIYSEQNELDYFLTLSRGERMKRIDNLLMIDKFEKARSSTVSLMNKLVERKLGEQSIIEQTDIEKLKKLVDELNEDLNKMRKDKLEISAEVEEINKQKNEMELDLRRLEQLNKDLNYFKEQEKSVESAIEENKKFINEIENLLKGRTRQDIENNIKEFSQKITELNNVLTEKRNEQEKLTELISESKTKIEFLESDKMRKLESDISKKLSIKEMVDEIKKNYGNKPLEKMSKEKNELNELVKKLSSLNTMLSETKEILDRIHELKDSCPICRSKLTEEKKKRLIKDQKEKIEKIEKEIKTLEKEKQLKEESSKSIEEVVDKFKHFLINVEDLDELQSQLKDLKKLYSKSIKTMEVYQKNLNKIKVDISNLQIEIEKNRKDENSLALLYSRTSEVENKRSRLSYLNSRIEDVRMKITEINKQLKDQDIEKLRKEFTELVSKKSEYEERLKNLNQSFKEKETRKTEEEKKISTIDKQKSEIVRLEKIINDLKIFEKALEQTQTELRTEFIDAVNYTMSEIWPNLYPYEDFIGIALNIEAGDYVLQLKDRMERWVNADGIASGGERSIACLALRIAFSLVLAPQLRWLVLDEPTHNLDNRSIGDLAETLRTRIGNFVDQVFLITHEERLEEAVTGNLYRLERDKRKDESTKILRSS